MFRLAFFQSELLNSDFLNVKIFANPRFLDAFFEWKKGEIYNKTKLRAKGLMPF